MTKGFGRKLARKILSRYSHESKPTLVQVVQKIQDWLSRCGLFSKDYNQL